MHARSELVIEFLAKKILSHIDTKYFSKVFNCPNNSFNSVNGLVTIKISKDYVTVDFNPTIQDYISNFEEWRQELVDCQAINNDNILRKLLNDLDFIIVSSDELLLDQSNIIKYTKTSYYGSIITYSYNDASIIFRPFGDNDLRFKLDFGFILNDILEFRNTIHKFLMYIEK